MFIPGSQHVLAFLRRASALLDGVFGEAVRGLMAETLIDPDRTAHRDRRQRFAAAAHAWARVSGLE
jgi:hypothetical protein